MSAKRTWAVLLALVIALAAASPGYGSVSGAALRPLALDDDIPGVPLDTYPVVSRTVTGTLDAVPISSPPEDAIDLFSLYLAPGDQIQARLTGNPGTDFDLYLFSPDSVTFIAAHEVMASITPASSSESICYTASERFGAGRYYLAVVTWNSEGSYQLDWHVSGRSDGNVPGRTLTKSSVTGTVDPFADRDDVYALRIAEMASVAVTLTVDGATAPVDLVVFPPVWNNGGVLEPTLDVYHAGDATARRGTVVTATVQPASGRDGTWYLDVRAVSGPATYTLEWQAQVDDVPGTPFEGQPVRGDLDPRRFISMPLRWGQELRGSLWTSPVVAVNGTLYGPAAASRSDTSAIVWSTSWPADNQPKRFSYTVPSENAEGAYFLNIERAADYALFEQRLWRAVSSRRLDGADRYATAVRIAQSGFRGGSDVVVVASGETFPDALSASGLAGAYDAPLLLVRKAALPDVVRAEIDRLAPSRVFVVGGPGAVSDAVLSAIAARPSVKDVTRVSGADRYETSAEVARRIASRLGPDFDGVVYVARGDLFPDALAVSPLAWRGRRPILLTRPTALPDSVHDALLGLAPSEAVVLGGTGAVSAAVYDAVAALSASARRIDGVDRYETAAKVAQDGIGTGVASPAFVALATGTNFPDALAGGALAGAESGVLVLTPPGALSPYAAGFLSGAKESVEACRLLGGAGALSDAVRASVDAALARTFPDDPPSWW
ncbi:MAG: cell wall-binding repeat-containing protein [Anaerosomatales bacterium]|nr:cell wall-binding repeat-containing protein [Anaerosomatales bacterium]